MFIILLFVFVMLSIFGKLAFFAIKATWKIGKALLFVVFLPIVIIALVFAGLFYIAIPLIVIAAIISLFVPKKI